MQIEEFRISSIRKDLTDYPSLMLIKPLGNTGYTRCPDVPVAVRAQRIILQLQEIFDIPQNVSAYLRGIFGNEWHQLTLTGYFQVCGVPLADVTVI